jgi:inosine-uridine nucleoside N-ribohydrolase
LHGIETPFKKKVEKNFIKGTGPDGKMKKKVIIDCDVGVDDALALILAFHSPGLEVKAVTGVKGNVPIDTVFPNIQKVLSLIQPPDQPVIARGASHPLKRKSFYAHSVHGEDGLGGAKTFYLHDPLAVGGVTDPELMSKEKLALYVETEEGERYGQVWEVAAGKGHQNIEVCLGVNSQKFLELFFSSLED